MNEQDKVAIEFEVHHPINGSGVKDMLNNVSCHLDDVSTIFLYPWDFSNYITANMSPSKFNQSSRKYNQPIISTSSIICSCGMAFMLLRL